MTLTKFHFSDNIHVNSKEISYPANQILGFSLASLFFNGKKKGKNYKSAPKPDIFWLYKFSWRVFVILKFKSTPYLRRVACYQVILLYSMKTKENNKKN